jgi:hypothetical protein
VQTQRKPFYETEGYWVERGLFSAAEMQQLNQVFMDMRAKGGVEGFYKPDLSPWDDVTSYSDPLARYPRVMHPHKFMPEAKRYLLEPRIFDLLEELMGEEALTAQSMFYFKPPQARGQAWHQDNFYLSVQPGTCIAAWIAVDPSDEENGGLQVLPNTQKSKLQCPETADPATSFAKELVRLPEGAVPEKLRLAPGDVLFFNGNVIHGSTPNLSKDRMRRSLILHYVGKSCQELSKHYHPLMDRQGNFVGRQEATGGGPCGTEVAQPH